MQPGQYQQTLKELHLNGLKDIQYFLFFRFLHFSCVQIFFNQYGYPVIKFKVSLSNYSLLLL